MANTLELMLEGGERLLGVVAHPADLGHGGASAVALGRAQLAGV